MPCLATYRPLMAGEVRSRCVAPPGVCSHSGSFFFPSSLCLELTAAVLSRGCTLALDSLQVPPPFLRRPAPDLRREQVLKSKTYVQLFSFFFFYRLFWTLKQSVRFKWSLPPAIPIFSGVGKVSFFAWAENVCCNLNCYCVLPRNLSYFHLKIVIIIFF